MKTSVLIRLAIVNFVGFSASTVMPLWLGGIARQFHMPGWFAGVAVLAQIGGAALFNLATPVLFRRLPVLPLARGALVVAALAYLLAVTSSPTLFVAACFMCGSALGVVLSVTNRLMGSNDHVQKGYAIFVLIEVCLATALFLTAAFLIAHYGVQAMFPAVSASALIALALLTRLPVTAAVPVAIAARSPPRYIKAAILCLGSFAFFFIGQATINSFMPTIGQAIGLATQQANQAIGLGMPFGFVGAMLARLVGERVPPMLPIGVVVVILSFSAWLLSFHPSFPIFIATVIALATSTIFCVPYFFAQLGALDGEGRYASFGPAMMLSGIAIGPSSAVILNGWFGLRAVGLFSATLLVLGGIGFASATHIHRLSLSREPISETSRRRVEPSECLPDL